jgi:protease PrsW
MFAPLIAMSAVVPSLLLVFYFVRRDLFPEPARVIWGTFGLGIATIPGVLLVAVPIGALLEGIPDPLVAGLLAAFLTAAVPEELFKFIVVRGFAARHAAFDEPMDGVVYGAVASLGFATLENILYVASGGFGVAALRAFTAVPAHAFMGAIMGYYVGRAKFHPDEKVRATVLAYFVPMVLHGLYDFPILTLKHLSDRSWPTDMAVPFLPISLLAFIILWVWAIRGLRRARADQERGLALSRVSLPPSAPRTSVIPAHGRGWVGGTVLLVIGLLFASGGGLIVFGMAYALATGSVVPHERASAVIGGVIIGVLPLLLGVLMFVLGLRRLNRSEHQPA